MIYEYNAQRTKDRGLTRTFIQLLPFIHINGSNAFIWSEIDNTKRLIHVDNYIFKKLTLIN